jgi:hypothetical protein
MLGARQKRGIGCVCVCVCVCFSYAGRGRIFRQRNVLCRGLGAGENTACSGLCEQLSIFGRWSLGEGGLEIKNSARHLAVIITC